MLNARSGLINFFICQQVVPTAKKDPEKKREKEVSRKVEKDLDILNFTMEVSDDDTDLQQEDLLLDTAPKAAPLVSGDVLHVQSGRRIAKLTITRKPNFYEDLTTATTVEASSTAATTTGSTPVSSSSPTTYSSTTATREASSSTLIDSLTAATSESPTAASAATSELSAQSVPHPISKSEAETSVVGTSASSSASASETCVTEPPNSHLTSNVNAETTSPPPEPPTATSMASTIDKSQMNAEKSFAFNFQKSFELADSFLDRKGDEKTNRWNSDEDDDQMEGYLWKHSLEVGMTSSSSATQKRQDVESEKRHGVKDETNENDVKDEVFVESVKREGDQDSDAFEAASRVHSRVQHDRDNFATSPPTSSLMMMTTATIAALPTRKDMSHLSPTSEAEPKSSKLWQADIEREDKERIVSDEETETDNLDVTEKTDTNGKNDFAPVDKELNDSSIPNPVLGYQSDNETERGGEGKDEKHGHGGEGTEGERDEKNARDVVVVVRPEDGLEDHLIDLLKPVDIAEAKCSEKDHRDKETEFEVKEERKFEDEDGEREEEKDKGEPDLDGQKTEEVNREKTEELNEQRGTIEGTSKGKENVGRQEPEADDRLEDFLKFSTSKDVWTTAGGSGSQQRRDDNKEEEEEDAENDFGGLQVAKMEKEFEEDGAVTTASFTFNLFLYFSSFSQLLMKNFRL